MRYLAVMNVVMQRLRPQQIANGHLPPSLLRRLYRASRLSDSFRTLGWVLLLPSYREYHRDGTGEAPACYRFEGVDRLGVGRRLRCGLFAGRSGKGGSR
jgi:hypothetical protein